MKKILITGAGRGLGLAIAKRLASPDVVLGLNVRRETDEVRALNGHILPFDVADADAAEKAVEAFGDVDVLVNNAGITYDMLAMRLSDDDIERVLGVDFVAAARLTRLCMRSMMKKRWGRIIQISSIIAKRGNAGQAAYAGAKAALDAYTKSVAKELAPRNVTLNSVAPGFIDTDMTRGLKEEWKDKILKEIPLKRFGVGADVAEVVAFLASDEASYVTGQVIDVTGGLLA